MAAAHIVTPTSTNLAVSLGGGPSPKSSTPLIRHANRSIETDGPLHGTFTLPRGKLILSTYLGVVIDSMDAQGLPHPHVFRKWHDEEGNELTSPPIVVRPPPSGMQRAMPWLRRHDTQLADDFLLDQLRQRSGVGKLTFNVEDDLVPCLKRLGLPTDDEALEELRRIVDALMAPDPPKGSATAEADHGESSLSKLETLPDELIMEIFSWLPYGALKMLREMKDRPKLVNAVVETFNGKGEAATRHRHSVRFQMDYRIRDLAEKAQSTKAFREGLLELMALERDFGVRFDEEHLHPDGPYVDALFEVLGGHPNLRSLKVRDWQGASGKVPYLLKSLAERHPALRELAVDTPNVGTPKGADSNYVKTLAIVPGLTHVRMRVEEDVTSTALAALLANPSLMDMDVWGHACTDEYGAALGPVLKEHKAIRKLKLPGMSDGALQEVAKGLAGNQSLESFEMSWGPFGKPGLRALGNALERNTRINHLSIGDTLDPDALEGLVSGLDRNKSIRSLRISNGSLSQQVSQSLTQALGRNTTLQSLDLTGLRMGNAGVNGITELLRHNRMLSKLVLYHCNIDSASALELASGVSCNETLRELVLLIKVVPGTDSKLEALAKALLEHPALEELRLWVMEMAGSLGPNLEALRAARGFKVSVSAPQPAWSLDTMRIQHAPVSHTLVSDDLWRMAHLRLSHAPEALAWIREQVFAENGALHGAHGS